MSEAYTLEALFKLFPGGICVPRIQRGYVQGRGDKKGIEIQKKFAPVLVKAVFGGKKLSLDFIYGVVVADEGAERCLQPLDGQQRLSTLLLLAWLCGKWKKNWKFSYQSRRIPQMFVRGLLENSCKATDKPSDEIEKAEWFLPIWKDDPSVAGMLRMLDALHVAIGERNRAEADFGRISFLLHGINGYDNTFDHVFRKMNARGKDLSPWENMKAMLDRYVPKDLAIDWRDNIDGVWAKCIWEKAKDIIILDNAMEKIVRLDNAMEKIVRTVYARFVSVEAQSNSLWEIEEKLMPEEENAFDEDKRCFFYQTTIKYFNALTIVAQHWTEIRTQNALWCEKGNDADFWKWLFDGRQATIADLLRIAFLAERTHAGVEDAPRRCRVLLNLLDNSSINKDNFAKALDAGLGFIAGDLDLKDIMSLPRQAGYSREQLEDEEWKYSFESGEIALLECHPLVWRGSTAFLGQMFPTDMSASLTKLSNAAKDNRKTLFLDILGLSGKCNTELPCKNIKIPKTDATWAEELFSSSRLFLREGIAAWLRGDHYDSSNGPSIWLNYLDSIWNIISEDLTKIALKNAGWLFCVSNKNLTDNAIRLVKSRIEYENIKKLDNIQISENGIYYLSWMNLPWDGFMKAQSGDWYWNVKQSSWWKCDEPPKYIQDSQGFHEIPRVEG